MICNTKISISHIEKFDRSSPKNTLKPLPTKGLRKNHSFCRFFKIYTFSRGIRCTSFINMWKFLFFGALFCKISQLDSNRWKKDDATIINLCNFIEFLVYHLPLLINLSSPPGKAPISLKYKTRRPSYLGKRRAWSVTRWVSGIWKYIIIVNVRKLQQ